MKNVWILGAGASISNNRTFPTIMDFFSRAKEYGILSNSIKSIKAEYADIEDYANKYLHKNIMRKDEKTDIESFLTHLYIEYENTKSHKIATIIERIVTMVQEVLHECHNRTSVTKDYETFLTNYVAGKNTSIITFNWDLLLDGLMEEKKLIQYENLIMKISAKYLWGYMNGPVHHPYSDYDNNSALYIKLHGSIDWITCKNSNCRLNNLMFIKEDKSKDYFCSECHEKCLVMIIPPILNKQYNEYPSIKKAWNLAFKEISLADSLTIWGYGVPPTDFYSNWLLSRAINENAIINIINPEAVNERRDTTTGTITFTINRIFANKFSEILGKRKINYYRYFEDFWEKKTIYDKYVNQ